MMPYNTRRKSLSLPSLGIHIPVTHAARAAAASRTASRPSSSSSSSSVPTSSSRAESPDAHPSKRLKRSHGADSMAIEQTPPPSPTAAASDDMTDADSASQIVLEGVNDDIVEAVIVQLQSTGNRPHLVKELATVLTQKLTSVQQSANPCAIISSRLASYMKRTCWTSLAPCPLAKELETVHPRRTYYFLTTRPRQPLPDFNASQIPVSIITPSVSLTDDSGSDDVEARRRELSPSPEVDLPPPEFGHVDDDDVPMPITPIGSYSSHRSRFSLDRRNNSPPLEKDEREFTQTADGLQKRKLNQDLPAPETVERNNSLMEYGCRDDIWFADVRATTFLASPSIKPSASTPGVRKEDDADGWLRLSKLFEWDKGAESIEIDELDCLLDAC